MSWLVCDLEEIRFAGRTGPEFFCSQHFAFHEDIYKMPDQQAKPFLKWAGGKTQLLTVIGSEFYYKNNDKFIYVEPFVGSGAVLFWVLNNHPNLEKVVINDINNINITINYTSMESLESQLLFTVLHGEIQ